MIKKHIYRATHVKEIDWNRLAEKASGERIVFAIDVAKEDFFGSLIKRDGAVLQTLKWQHPNESPYLLEQLNQYVGTAGFEVVMEPSGVYGDALRFQFYQSGIDVYSVMPKKVFDSREIYDGVSSLHDAKSAWLIGKLHREGLTQPWKPYTENRRNQLGLVDLLEWKQNQIGRERNYLESRLSRHWPEVSLSLELGSATLLALIARYGSPEAAAKERKEAAALMRRVGGPMLAQEKICAVLASAEQTLGVKCTKIECRVLMELAQSQDKTRIEIDQIKKELEALAEADSALDQTRQLVGRVTAVVIQAKQGKVTEYASARSYLKSMGLNLKEKSSGKHQGQLKITKRGPGIVRKYLYWAVLRLIRKEPVIQSWYQRKVERDGGKGGKAITALMRKLALALWYVGQGEQFDASKLFCQNP